VFLFGLDLEVILVMDMAVLDATIMFIGAITVLLIIAITGDHILTIILIRDIMVEDTIREDQETIVPDQIAKAV